MREKQVFAKLLSAVARDDRQREAAQFAKTGVAAGECHWHEAGANFREAEAKLFRDAIAEIGRAELRKREAARRHDQRCAVECSRGSLKMKAVGLPHRVHPAVERDLRVRGPAFVEQHLDDLPRAAIAKLLAQLFLVIGDSMLLHKGDEIPGREAGERRFAEIRLAGNEVLRTGLKVGEIAAAPPEIAIFLPTRSLCSSSMTRRPRRPAWSAHIRPAAPPPITTTSQECASRSGVIPLVQFLQTHQLQLRRLTRAPGIDREIRIDDFLRHLRAELAECRYIQAQMNGAVRRR